jgi:ribulose 1,5-bisphosphate carboxylase large subunit-like protein
MTNSRILATYRIETPHPVDVALEKMLNLMTTGTFTPVPGETDEIRERFSAEVVQVVPLPPVDRPSLPAWNYRTRQSSNTFQRAEAVLSFPLALTETDLTNLMATLWGGVYGMAELSGIRLLDLKLPPAFASAHPGPQFGVQGTRRLTGVHGRPIIASIIKPNVGLSPEQTADIVKELVAAGVDFIKDDEKLTSPVYSTTEARVQAVMAVILEHAQRTGKQVMYAFNISSDDPDEMVRRHDIVADAGGTAVMVSIAQVGLGAVRFLRRRCRLPIHGHRNGWELLTRSSDCGIDFRAWHQLYRLAGVDQIHVNGIRNKFWESDESVVRSIEACLTPLFAEEDRVMPVVGSGMWAGQAPDTYRLTGGAIDLIYIAGGGIQGHPDGPGAGVRSIRQAWEAAMSGISLEEYARDHGELAAALRRWG